MAGPNPDPTGTQNLSPLLVSVRAALAGLGRVAVAFSGGRDSTALLHAVCAVAPPGVGVHALHVDHGLNPRSADWAAHAQSLCAEWAAGGAPLQVHVAQLKLRPAPGESVEALARTARYAALARLAREAGCDTVLLAHHRDDQVETFLLQALRGAGAAGLAAMPARAVRHGCTWLRPWLSTPRAQIEAHVARNALPVVDDDSNADARYARNRLRLHVLPALRAQFDDADASLATAARHSQDAREALAALAAIDQSAVAHGPGLTVPMLLALDGSRQRNLLRHWLLARSGHAPAATLLMRLPEQLTHAPNGRWPHRGGQLAAYRGVLDWVGPAFSEGELGQSCAGGVAADAAVHPLTALHLGANSLPGWSGVLWVESVETGGVAWGPWSDLTVRARRGSERFQRDPHGLPRSLKKQFQAAAVPAWQRGGPLLFRGDALLFVPGLGLDARQLAPAGVAQVGLRWQAADASGVGSAGSVAEPG
jgi:tRNA(Ile)-lysidine synthase